MKFVNTIKKIRIILLSVLFASCVSKDVNKKSGLQIVVNGNPNSVLFVPEKISELQQIAVNDFIKIVERASGAQLPVLKESEVLEVEKNKIKIVLGPSKLTQNILGSNPELKPEEYKIITKDNYLVILANDIENKPINRSSRVTSWAFGYLLENFLNVKWLWPGDLGTVVPEQKDINFPLLNVSWQQPLQKRRFNLLVDSNPELLQWTAYHQVAGERKKYNFMHSYRKIAGNGDWWEKFYDTHPEYLAKNPEGKIEQNPRRPTFFKLCLSEPGVQDEIIKTWEEAGMPDYWDVTPNDGNGFCTCDNCMALDAKYGNETYTKEEVWKRSDHVMLTGRYVWFWNQLTTKMRKKNPNVYIGVFLYSAYRDAPKKLKVEPGVWGEIVHGFDFTSWQEWEKAGVSGIALRPNWWHMGACAPNLPLHQAGAYVEKARNAKMIHIYMDSLLEYWATQGPYYYLLARLVARPDLTTNDIIAEYCAAFGEASEEILEYLKYWETYHKKVAYNIPAGGKLSQDPNGIYETVSQEHFGEILHPLQGHWRTLPYIYTTEVMQPAIEILERAGNKTKDKETLKRIEFLRDGLVLVEKALNYMATEKNMNIEPLQELVEFGKKMNLKYDYWGSRDIHMMKHWGLIGEEMNVDDM